MIEYFVLLIILYMVHLLMFITSNSQVTMLIIQRFFNSSLLYFENKIKSVSIFCQPRLIYLNEKIDSSHFVNWLSRPHRSQFVNRPTLIQSRIGLLRTSRTVHTGISFSRFACLLRKVSRLSTRPLFQSFSVPLGKLLGKLILKLASTRMLSNATSLGTENFG